MISFARDNFRNGFFISSWLYVFEIPFGWRGSGGNWPTRVNFLRERVLDGAIWPEELGEQLAKKCYFPRGIRAWEGIGRRSSSGNWPTRVSFLRERVLEGPLGRRSSGGNWLTFVGFLKEMVTWASIWQEVLWVQLAYISYIILFFIFSLFCVICIFPQGFSLKMQFVCKKQF